MKLISLLLLAVQGCLATGCMLPPMTAKEMMQLDQPTAEINFPKYGAMKIPTNAKIRMKMEDNPDGTGKVDFTMASDAGAVIEEVSGQIGAMTPMRNAYTAGQVETSLAATQMMGGVFHDVMDVVKVALPLMARPTPTPEPPGGPAGIDMAALRAQLEAEIMEKLFASGVIPRPAPPPP